MSTYFVCLIHCLENYLNSSDEVNYFSKTIYELFTNYVNPHLFQSIFIPMEDHVDEEEQWFKQGLIILLGQQRNNISELKCFLDGLCSEIDYCAVIYPNLGNFKKYYKLQIILDNKNIVFDLYCIPICINNNNNNSYNIYNKTIMSQIYNHVSQESVNMFNIVHQYLQNRKPWAKIKNITKLFYPVIPELGDGIKKVVDCISKMKQNNQKLNNILAYNDIIFTPRMTYQLNSLVMIEKILDMSICMKEYVKQFHFIASFSDIFDNISVIFTDAINYFLLYNIYKMQNVQMVLKYEMKDETEYALTKILHNDEQFKCVNKNIIVIKNIWWNEVMKKKKKNEQFVQKCLKKIPDYILTPEYNNIKSWKHILTLK